MRERQHAAPRTHNTLPSLHIALMLLHATFQRLQPSRLPYAQQLLHLRLQHTQLTQHLLLKLTHPTTPLTTRNPQLKTRIKPSHDSS